MKIPNWTREELILVLDLYLKNRKHFTSISESVLDEYSNLCKKLHPQHYIDTEPNFRSANAIYIKLESFRCLDPEWPEHSGLSNLGENTISIWNELSNNPDGVTVLADKIKRSIKESI